MELDTRQSEKSYFYTLTMVLGCSCVFQRPDSDGFVGVSLNKDLVAVAGKALERRFPKLHLIRELVTPEAEFLQINSQQFARCEAMA